MMVKLTLSTFSSQSPKSQSSRNLPCGLRNTEGTLASGSRPEVSAASASASKWRLRGKGIACSRRVLWTVVRRTALEGCRGHVFILLGSRDLVEGPGPLCYQSIAPFSSGLISFLVSDDALLLHLQVRGMGLS